LAKKKKKPDFEILEEGYTSYRVPLGVVKPNPSNPRSIEDNRLKKLAECMREKPKVLKAKPIIVNKDMVILGGNQRFKAAKLAGLDSVWILNADDIEDQEQRDVIISDNVDFGKWDRDLMKAFGYSDNEIFEAGGEEVDFMRMGQEALGVSEEKNMNENSIPSEDLPEPDVDESDLAQRYETYQNNTIKQVVLYYPTDIYEKALRSMDEISKELDCDDNSEVVLKLINFWEFNHGKNATDFDSFEGESREDEDDEDIG